MENQINLNKIFDLSNKVAIITGGYGYLGATMARSLAAYGAIVIVAGRSMNKYVQAFSSKERDLIHFKELDITQTNSIEGFFKDVNNEFGKVDILVNNAHSIRGNSQENLSDEDWNYSFEGIVGAVYKMIRSVIPIMKFQQSGKIVNISSMYGIVSPNFGIYEGDLCRNYTNPPHYGAAKAALNQLTRYFAVLLGPHKIQVNGIAPGPFPNTIIQNENPLFVERLQKMNPSNRIGKPEDLAGVIALLSSSGSDFITGQIIQVDGGWTIW